ncbi:MAG: hypothetical protein MK052_06205 [Alphaproteobacteria bacterium]|nr:hypothetical protein [Alphaproteobacteria bacterium]
MPNKNQVITFDDLETMRLFLEYGSQSEMYRYYARKTGSNQAARQGDISAPHTFKGRIAREANYLALEEIEKDLAIGIYPKEGVDSFSKEIATDFFEKVKSDVESGGNGILADGMIGGLARDVWRRKGLEAYFPGNITTVSHFFSAGTAASFRAGI